MPLRVECNGKYVGLIPSEGGELPVDTSSTMRASVCYTGDQSPHPVARIMSFNGDVPLPLEQWGAQGTAPIDERVAELGEGVWVVLHEIKVQRVSPIASAPVWHTRETVLGKR